MRNCFFLHIKFEITFILFKQLLRFKQLFGFILMYLILVYIGCRGIGNFFLVGIFMSVGTDMF